VADVVVDGTRCVVVASPERYRRDSARLTGLIARTEEKLVAREWRVRHGDLVDPGKIGRSAQRILSASGVPRLFDLEIDKGRFLYHYDEEALEFERELLCGRYVLAATIEALRTRDLRAADIRDPDIKSQHLSARRATCAPVHGIVHCVQAVWPCRRPVYQRALVEHHLRRRIRQWLRLFSWHGIPSDRNPYWTRATPIALKQDAAPTGSRSRSRHAHYVVSVIAGEARKSRR
jgi:hypothetical protein